MSENKNEINMLNNYFKWVLWTHEQFLDIGNQVRITYNFLAYYQEPGVSKPMSLADTKTQRSLVYLKLQLILDPKKQGAHTYSQHWLFHFKGM